MSGAVDTKTVEMRFDNKDFESNCKQSLSTLEKLKTALKLDGASKGLSEIGKASKKLDMKDLQNNVETVGHKFSILEQIGIGVLRRIGAVAAEEGIKIAKSLTIDQLASGWSKYEEKTKSVQTIMSNLREDTSKFTDDISKMDYVNEQIEKLNWFSDETSYSLTDMTSNIGKFVANGQGLEESVTAMEGIATWAALSGQNSQTAARAMYNISQAMGAGSMKIKDWMSIENANMATAEFKETAIKIAEQKGKIKEGQVTIENFRESLSAKGTKNWFDKEVMLATFQEYGSAVELVRNKIEQVREETRKAGNEQEITASKAIEMLKAEDSTLANSLGFRAFAAAQEAKTLREALDATADAVSTKWTQIFEQIFGNYLQQKKLWTDLSNDLWDVFAAPLDTLKNVFKSWNEGVDGISGRTHLIEGLKNVFDALIHDTEDEKGNQILSFFGAIREGFKDAFFAGETVESLGKKLFGFTEKFFNFTQKIKPSVGAFNKLRESVKSIFSGLGNLVDIFVRGDKSILHTLTESFKDVFDLSKPFDRIKNMLADLPKKFEDLTVKLKPSEETLSKLKDAFSGFFRVIKMGGQFIGAVLKPILNLFKTTSESGSNSIGGKILDIASSFGKWTEETEKWVKENKVFEQVSNFMTSTLQRIEGGIDSLAQKLGAVSFSDLIDQTFGKIGSFLGNVIDQIKEVEVSDGALDKVLTPFQKFYIGAKTVLTAIVKFFASIGPAISSAIEFLRGIIKQIREVKNGGENIESSLTPFQKFYAGARKVFSGIKNFFISIGGIIATVVKFFKNFIDKIKQLSIFGRDVENSLTPFQRFYNFSKEVFAKIKQFFTSIGSSLKEVGVNIKTAFSSLIESVTGKDLASSMSQFTPIWVGIKATFKGIVEFFAKIAPTLQKVGEWLGQAISAFGDAIAKLSGDMSGLEIIESLLKSKFLISLIRFVKYLRKPIKDIVGIFKDLAGSVKGIVGVFKAFGNGVTGVLGAVANILNSYTKRVNSESLLNIAAAIAVFSGSLWLLSKIPSTELQKAGKAMAQLLGVIMIAMTLMRLIGKIKTAGGEKLNVFGQIKDMFTGLIQNTIFANDASAKFLKISTGLLLSAIAAKKLVEAVSMVGDLLVKLGKADDVYIKKGGKIVGQIIALFGVFALLAGFTARTGSALAAAVAALVLIKAIGKVVNMMAELGGDQNKIKNLQNFFDSFGDVFTKLGSFILKLVGIIALSQVLVAIAAACGETTSVAKALKQFGRNFERIAASLLIVAAAAWLFTKINLSENSPSVGAMMATFGGFVALAGIMQIWMAYVARDKFLVKRAGLDKILKTFGNNFIKIAASLGIVAGAAAQFLHIQLSENSPSVGAMMATFGGFIVLAGAFQVWIAKVSNKQSALAMGNPMNRVLKTFGNNFLKIAGSLYIVAMAVQKMAEIKTVTPGSAGLTTSLLVMTGFLGLVGGFQLLIAGMASADTEGAKRVSPAISAMAAAFLAAAGSLLIVSYAVKMMAGIKFTENSPEIGHIIGLFLGFIALVGLFSTLSGALTKNAAGAVAIGLTAASYIAAAYSLKMLAEAFNSISSSGASSVDPGLITGLFLGFVGIVGACGVLAGALTKDWKGVAAMGVMAVSYIAAAYAIQLVADAFVTASSVESMSNPEPITTLFLGFIGVVGVFGILAGVLVSNGTGIAAMGVMAGSYVVAAGALYILGLAINEMCSGTSVEQLQEAVKIIAVFGLVVGGLALIGGLLGAFGGAGAIAGMASIAGIIVSIGAACLMAGAGIGIAAAGIGLLVDAVASLVEALAIYGPQAAESIGTMVNAILDALIGAAPKLLQLGTILIISLALGIAQAAPVLAQAALQLLIDLLNVFAKGLPALAEAIVALIAAGIRAIAAAIRAASSQVLPAVADVLGAILSLTFDVLAALIETIPGWGPKAAEKIREWGSDIDSAVASAFGGAEAIARDAHDATVEGFSGGGAGRSFAEAGEDGTLHILEGAETGFAGSKEVGQKGGQDLTDGYSEALDNAKDTSVNDSTTGLFDKIKSIAEQYSLDGASAFDTDFISSMKTALSDSGLGDLTDGQFGDILTAVVSGDTSALAEFMNLPEGMQSAVQDSSLGSDTEAKVSEMAPAIASQEGAVSSASGGLVSTISSKITAVVGQAMKWGSDLGEKFAAGIRAKIGAVRGAVSALASVARSYLHFSEPDVGPLSDFHTYAPDMVKLWCKGVYDNLGLVEDSSDSMSKTVKDGLSSALGYVSDLIDGGMTDELTIRPVMDLSEIQNGVDSIGDILGNQGYSVGLTGKLASYAANGMNTIPISGNATSDSQPSQSVVNNNTFNITNDDPNAVAQKVSRLLDQSTNRAKAVWAQ